ncbi:MAG TPA: hypothetical protein GXX75_21185 [Clostridiales bacterium]|nr:hypothetical protein [Clostridiales bacterium]
MDIQRINGKGRNDKKIKDTAWARKGILKKILVTCMVLSIVLGNPIDPGTVKAADIGGSVGVTINYVDELATVVSGPGGSSKFYLSTDGKKSWEMLDEGTNTVDLSAILSTREVTIYFKGNRDTREVACVLPAQDPKDLTASYKIVGGVGRIEFQTTTGSPVEFKKGANGAWKTATNPMYTAIYEVKGAALYFRTAATASKRSGKIINVKVPKRPTAPSVKVDGSKMIITGLKKGVTYYRRSDNPSWTLFNPSDSKVNYLDLRSLLGIAATETILPGTVEFYQSGSDKKRNSSIKIIDIAAQAPAPGQVVSISGTTITIKDTNLKTTYEYTVVNKSSTFDIMKARWTPVTAKKPVVAKNVSIGDKIYVRLKSTTDPVTKQPILASAPFMHDVTSITPAK